MNKKINACINILSSRTQCLPLCLESLWDKWNYRYNYPVYVHYFDDIYDDEDLRKRIISKSKSDAVISSCVALPTFKDACVYSTFLALGKFEPPCISGDSSTTSL